MERAMFDRIAYCGQDCSRCPVYRATIENNLKRKKRIAELWSSEELQLKPEDIFCHGCTSENGRLFAYCKTCEVRQCAREAGLRNCAWCAQYPCQKLMAQYRDSRCRGGKEQLDAIREDLLN